MLGWSSETAAKGAITLIYSGLQSIICKKKISLMNSFIFLVHFSLDYQTFLKLNLFIQIFGNSAYKQSLCQQGKSDSTLQLHLLILVQQLSHREVNIKCLIDSELCILSLPITVHQLLMKVLWCDMVLDLLQVRVLSRIENLFLPS